MEKEEANFIFKLILDRQNKLDHILKAKCQVENTTDLDNLIQQNQLLNGIKLCEHSVRKDIEKLLPLVNKAFKAVTIPVAEEVL